MSADLKPLCHKSEAELLIRTRPGLGFSMRNCSGLGLPWNTSTAGAGSIQSMR